MIHYFKGLIDDKMLSAVIDVVRDVFTAIDVNEW